MWAQQGEGRDRDEVPVGGPCGRLLGSSSPGKKARERWTDALVGLKAAVKWGHIKGARETRGMGEADGGWSLLPGRARPSS